MNKELQEALEKSIPTIVEGVKTELTGTVEKQVWEKITELESKLNKLLDANNLEVKSLISKKSLSKDEQAKIEKKSVAGWMLTYLMDVTRWVAHTVEKKSMGETVVWGWAELVFEKFSNDVRAVFEQNSLIQMIKKEDSANAYTYIIPKFDGETLTSFKVGENNKPSHTQWTTDSLVLTLYKRVVLTSISEDLLKDNATVETIYDLLVRQIWVEYASSVEKEILNGDGTGWDIKWLLNAANTDVVVVSLDTGNQDFSDVWDSKIVELVTSVEDKYGNDEDNVFVMHKSVKWLLMQLKSEAGIPYYPELRSKEPTILGYKVVTSTKAPKITDSAANKRFIAFGNFQNITLAEKGWEEIELGYSADGFETGTKTLRAIKKDALGIVYPKAFAVLKTAA